MRSDHYPKTGNPIVFFDFETTGLCSKKDSIIEVAAVKYIPGASSHPHMSYLIAIDRPLPRFITKLTGIDDRMLKANGRAMRDVLDEFIEFVGGHSIVSYNISFDARFLNAAIEQHGRRPLSNIRHCALAQARQAWPDLDTHKLASVARHLNLEIGNAHRALDDTLLALEVYFHSQHAGDSHEMVESVNAVMASTPRPIPTITGPRQFRIEVIGTSRNQGVFEAACGPHTERGAALDIQVQLRVETHAKGVKVLLQEDVVGNLAPRVAQDFRRAIIDGGLAEFSHFECAAKIRGGKIGESGAGSPYVMWLDIPQDDD